MQQIVADPALVAHCGLYCGACRAHRKGRCPGCHENTKATWCKIRACCAEHGYSTCASCEEFADPMACGKFNNLLSRIFGFVLRSNRAACIAQVRALGIEGHAQTMAEMGRQSMPR